MQLDSCCKGEKLCWSKKKLCYEHRTNTIKTTRLSEKLDAAAENAQNNSSRNVA
jgi:hypothetical protein